MSAANRLIEVLRAEAAYFATAVQFLTRLPTPQLSSFEPIWLNRSAAYFPIVGLLVGAISAAVLLVGSTLGLPGALPVVLAVAAGILTTGAFHEDGLADTFDGLGGGQNRQQKLTIMKDSRVGTYGLCAVVIALAIKTVSLAALPVASAALALVVSHAGARMIPVIASAMLPYGGETTGSKVAPIEPSPARLAVALVTGLLPFLGLPVGAAILAIVCGGTLSGLILAWAQRAIGGHTGDVLGAAEQAFEVAVLVALAALLK